MQWCPTGRPHSCSTVRLDDDICDAVDKLAAGMVKVRVQEVSSWQCLAHAMSGSQASCRCARSVLLQRFLLGEAEH